MWIDVAYGALLLAAALLAVPTVVLLVQVLAAWPAGRARRRPAAATDGTTFRPRVAVLVPAHNEASGIAATLATIKPQLRQGDRLLVVADNCSDDTAAMAAAERVEVVERQHATQRGKGYALDHGLRHLEAMPPEVVVMVDADCAVGAGCIDHLARTCVASRRTVQALYLMQAPPAASVRQRIAAFAWVVKNQVRPSGGQRLGMPCQLMGTGMAFEWHIIAGAPLASGNIVEDMQLGLDLALRGQPALFAPEVLVTSQFPDTDVAAASQRTRWEHGHLATLIKGVPALVAGGLRRRDARLLGLALDLCVPPLALLLLLVGLLTLGGIAWWWGTSDPEPLAWAGMLLALQAVAVAGAWWRYGRHLIGLLELASAPIYALRKVPLYLRFIVNRQVAWVRAKRDDES